MHADTVTQDRLVTKPGFLLVCFFLSSVGFFFAGLGEGFFGHLLAPVSGDPETSGNFGDFAVAVTLAALFTANIVALSFVPWVVQVILVWLELLALFLLFFYSFDLSIEFIEEKIWFMISRGLFTTIYVSAISIVIATTIAVIGAIAKLSSNGFAFAIASFYTSFFRGLPLLMQVYLIYLGLPQLGYVVDAVPAGILALSLCYGAYMTEIFRAGIESIHKGQWEAARALGFRFPATMRKIILPQAIPIIIPPTGNQFIAMLKDSSLVSVIGVWELMFLARTLGQKDFRHLEMLITASLIYWGLTVVLEVIQARIEQHYRQKK
ncbi:MAG: amino acid ABC transporter permease [Hyphomicrobiales bacterium]|nr:amino acid ABC transporter permease [Hyphomicrobiales bacterium]MCY4048496.1 amino acid ABC transporter permease [Hyphomicrobiales bacterium]